MLFITQCANIRALLIRINWYVPLQNTKDMVLVLKEEIDNIKILDLDPDYLVLNVPPNSTNIVSSEE